MTGIIFEEETRAITMELQNANGYLDCENIILNNLRKHDANKVSIVVIESYLKRLLAYLEDKTIINKGNSDCENYGYAAGFLRSITETPYWDRWK
jgi:hypothetical protein